MRVKLVFGDNQRTVEKYLLTFPWRDPMPKPVFVRVAGIPLEY
jgi:hypothetical protein